MRPLLLLAFTLSTLVSVSGCATSASNRIASPDAADDPAYTPPGQMNVTINSASATATTSTSGGKGAAMAAPQPNKSPIRARSIRAAMY